MFDTTDIDSYYSEAVKDAVIKNENKRNNQAIFFNIRFNYIGVISIFGYKYLKEDKLETKVLGVTHTAQKNIGIDNNIDFTSEIDKIDKETSDEEYSSQLEKYISQEMEIPNKRSENKLEIDKSNDKQEKNIVIIVQRGDTLASLAKKYYHNSEAYDLIIQNNRDIFQKSNTIYPGQELKIVQGY